MKNRILFILGVLMMVSTVEAKTSKEQPNSKWDYEYNHNAEPISFMERGIKFFIFTDGEMDFDIHANDYETTTEYYYKSKSRRAKSRTSQRYGGVPVTKDYRGRVIRVGRVFINYNYRGNVSRVGSVFIGYRRDRMTRVGGLRIIYDRYGVRYRGQVKHRHHYNTGYYSNFYNDYFWDNIVYDYNDNFFDDDFNEDYEQFEEDDDYYYYRSKSSKMKNLKGKRMKKQKMIKRKKNKSRYYKKYKKHKKND